MMTLTNTVKDRNQTEDETLLMTEPLLLKRLDDAYGGLSKQNKRVCAFIRRNHLKAAFLTTSEIAQQAGVSGATVVRCAEALGFDGFSDLQSKLRELAAQGLGTEYLRVHAPVQSKGEEGVLSAVASLSSSTLAEVAEQNDPEAFSKAAKILFKAKRILVAGHKASAGSAVHAAYVLSKIHANVHLVETPNSFDGFASADLGPEDGLLVFTVIYYPTATLEIMRLMAAQGVPIVLVTDFKTFDEAKLATETILVPIRFFGFLDQTAPLLAAADALAYAVYQEDEEKGKARLHAFNEFNERLHAFSQVGRFTE